MFLMSLAEKPFVYKDKNYDDFTSERTDENNKQNNYSRLFMKN